MKSAWLFITEMFLILLGLVLYALGYLPFPILPLILVAWASLHLRQLRWRDVGLRRPERWMYTFGLALLFGIGYQALDILLIAPLLQKLTGEAVDLSQFDLLRGNFLALLFSLLVSWTEAAFIEEMFFRGYLFNRLAGLFHNERLGIAIGLLGSAFVFAAGHAYQGFTGILDTALAGLLLGLLYLLARRNLWLPILTHGVIDTAGFLLIFAGLVS